MLDISFLLSFLLYSGMGNKITGLLTNNSEDLLPVKSDYMTDDLKGKISSELNEDIRVQRLLLHSLRTKIKEEDELHCQDDDQFLLAFLRARNYDVEKAFNLIKGHYMCIGEHGHIFHNLKFDYLNRIMEENVLTFLPYRDREGSTIFVVRPGLWNPDTSSVEEHLVSAVLGFIQSLLSPSNQVAGFQVILDFINSTPKHFLRTSLSEIKFFSDVLQHAMPIEVRGIHVINENVVFYSLWSIFQIFLSKTLREKVHFHGSDVKSLHNFFHPSILPAEWEGELPPFNNSDWRKRIEESNGYLQHVLSFGFKRHLKAEPGGRRTTQAT